MSSSTWASIVIWVSFNRGRIGPANRGLVAIVWPKSSSSPGPAPLSRGEAAPTITVCPAAFTDCMGVIWTASHTAAAQMTANPETSAARLTQRSNDRRTRMPVDVAKAGNTTRWRPARRQSVCRGAGCTCA